MTEKALTIAVPADTNVVVIEKGQAVYEERAYGVKAAETQRPEAAESQRGAKGLLVERMNYIELERELERRGDPLSLAAVKAMRDVRTQAAYIANRARHDFDNAVADATIKLYKECDYSRMFTRRPDKEEQKK